MSLTGEATPLPSVRGANCLIDRLPRRQRDAVTALCDTVELPVGTVVCVAGSPFEFVYFPISGSISLLRSIDGHEPFVTENIGSEGMLGAVLILGVNQAHQRGVVQTPCLALRISSDRVDGLLDAYPALLAILQRYLYVVLGQLSQSTGCVRFHDVESRLARGLLVAHDRVRSDDLPLLTHKLLAELLGVQRGSVTIAAAHLQRQGAIRYSRGRIAVLDREKLEVAACGCYQESIEDYESLLAAEPWERKILP